MTRHISVNVGGLWRMSVELKEDATWKDLRKKIEKVTGIWQIWQKLEPCDLGDKKCLLEEGDDVFCDWKLLQKDHPLHYAAMDGNKEAIQSWLASGADVNTKNHLKRTPLMFASKHLKEECVIELLRLGANVQMTDNDSNTALHYVVNKFNNNLKKIKRMAKILIKAGCDPTIQNRNGDTFIDILKNRECHEVATKLEEWIKKQTKE